MVQGDIYGRRLLRRRNCTARVRALTLAPPALRMTLSHFSESHTARCSLSIRQALTCKWLAQHPMRHHWPVPSWTSVRRLHRGRLGVQHQPQRHHAESDAAGFEQPAESHGPIVPHSVVLLHPYGAQQASKLHAWLTAVKTVEHTMSACHGS